MIRNSLAVALIGSGLGLMSLVLAASEQGLMVLPIVAGELSTGLWLFLLQLGECERG